VRYILKYKVSVCFNYKVDVGLAKAGPFLFGYLKYWSYIYSIIKHTQ